MENNRKQQGMWDLLIPIMLIIVVLPLAVRLAIYSCGYSRYDWYSSNDILTDFYCYYKSYLLDIIGIFAGFVLIFRLVLYREKTKNMLIFIPLAVYCLSVILSTVFSVNQDASLKGNFESFESMIVLIVYIIMALYSYQIMEYERDYKYIWYALLAISTIFIIIGAFQISGNDLLNYEWAQRLIMTKEQFAAYAGSIENTFTGNNVYLTLYNPNYAGVTLCMLFSVIWVMALSESQKKLRMLYFIFAAAVLTLLWFTYSRASLLAALLVIIFSGISLAKKAGKKQLFIGAGLLLLLFACFVCADASLNFKYLSRMIDKNTREPLTRMLAQEQGIDFTYAGTDYTLYIEDNTLCFRTLSGDSPLCAEERTRLALPVEEDAYAVFWGDEINLYLADNTLTFLKGENGYSYVTPSGNPAQMTEVESVDFHGLEYLGSARGFIWSRTLPLLDDYFFLGSGPDTFAQSFPQEDYCGKIVYSDRPDMVIEKAHNDYLTKWVQTGGISVCCILIFYICFIRYGFSAFSGNVPVSLQMRLGSGCFLACLSFMFTALFNDSTLQTAPLFWILAGIALSSIYQKNNGLP